MTRTYFPAPLTQDQKRWNYLKHNQKFCTALMEAARPHLEKDPYDAAYQDHKNYLKIMANSLDKVSDLMNNHRFTAQAAVDNIAEIYTAPALNTLL